MVDLAFTYVPIARTESVGCCSAAERRMEVPFLTAVINESIRLGGSTATRTARISPASNPITYANSVFPPTMPVSATPFDVMTNPQIFPDPDNSNSMRWPATEPTGSSQQAAKLSTALDKYFVGLSRGPRSCVGMWLAWLSCNLPLHTYIRSFI